jgi:hypothetical protein
LGAVGAGLFSKLNKLYRISKLRSIANSRGLQNMGKKGYTETWKNGSNSLEKLDIKFQAGKSPGLQAGSKVPRFSYRIGAGKFWDPFSKRRSSMWVQMMKGQPSGLIQVLLDNGAEFGDRHDAAMDLGAFDEVSVEEALARLACDKGADDDLADACAESLAQIWCRKGDVTRDVIDVMIRLTPVSLRVALATMRECSPLLAAKADSILRADDQKSELE